MILDFCKLYRENEIIDLYNKYSCVRFKYYSDIYDTEADKTINVNKLHRIAINDLNIKYNYYNNYIFIEQPSKKNRKILEGSEIDIGKIGKLLLLL